MQRRSRLLFAAALMAAGTLALAWDASAQEPVTSRFKLSIGGYIKPEILYRTNFGGVGVAGNSFGISNFGFAVVPQKNTVGGDSGTMSVNVNESRFGFTINAPDWRGMKSMGFMEFDFAGNTNENVSYCPTTVCVTAQNSVGSPQTSGFGYGGFRLRHAFFRLSGEGLGGSWSLIAGQTWGVFGMLPYYSNSTLDFGGGSIWGQRQPQFTLQHTLPFGGSFQWINTAGVFSDADFLNELPAIQASTRFVWTGWQGWNGGVRTPLHVGFSAMTQRNKAQVTGPAATAASQPQRALSTTAWGVTAGYFFPILPGTSATDRTWALSAIGEVGTGSGLGLIPGASPLPGGTLLGVSNQAVPGAVFFVPGSCTGLTAGGGAAQTATGTNICPAGMAASEIAQVKQQWTSWGLQFYLPWNLWLSGGQKYIWFPNGDNAVAATTLANGSFVNPVGQGQNRFTANGTPISAPTCEWGDCTALNTTRDSLIKRLTYSYVALFYDVNPNIRLGFEYGRHVTNRKNQIQDNSSDRWQFGAYYFF